MLQRHHRRASLDWSKRSDHNGHMIRTLKESKAKLSELVELASQGQEILITVRGRVKARLVPADGYLDEGSTEEWLARLKTSDERFQPRSGHTTEEILEELREDRL